MIEAMLMGGGKAAPKGVFVAYYSSSYIHQLDADTMTLIDDSFYAHNCRTIALGPDDMLYYGAGVSLYRASGKIPKQDSSYVSNVGYTNEIVFDNDGFVYAASDSDGSIRKIDMKDMSLVSTNTDTVKEGYSGGGVAAFGLDGMLYASGRYSGTNGQIFKIDPETMITVDSLTTGEADISGLVYSSNGYLYYSSYDSAIVGKINPSTMYQETTISNVGRYPRHLAEGDDGFLYLTDKGGPSLIKINPDSMEVVGTAAQVGHSALTASLDGYSFAGFDYYDTTVKKVNTVTMEVVASYEAPFAANSLREVAAICYAP